MYWNMHPRKMRKLNILSVGYNEFSASICNLDESYNVHKVSSAAETYFYINNNAYDAICLDCSIDDISTYELFNVLCEDGHEKKLVVSCYGDKKQLEDYMGRPIENSVGEPFELEKIYSILKSMEVDNGKDNGKDNG